MLNPNRWGRRDTPGAPRKFWRGTRNGLIFTVLLFWLPVGGLLWWWLR